MYERTPGQCKQSISKERDNPRVVARRRTAIVLHSSFSAQLRPLTATPGYRVTEAALRRWNPHVFASRQDKPYPYQYLLGAPSFQGLLKWYIDRGDDTALLEERCLSHSVYNYLDEYDHFDFQFSTSVNTEVVHAIAAAGKSQVGWCPRVLMGKHIQASHLSRQPGTRELIPVQLLVPSLEQLREVDAGEIVQRFPSDYLIAKAYYTSRSRMPDGSDYVVFAKKSWDRFVDIAQHHQAWFEGEHGIIVSELVETRDPYLPGFNAVVHKIHLPTGLDLQEPPSWAIACLRLPFSIHTWKVGADVLPLEAVIETSAWIPGHLHSRLQTIKSLMTTLLPFPCLLGIDLMFRPDGSPVFLEFNKIAATYLDRTDGQTSALQGYMDLLECDKASSRIDLSAVQAFQAVLAELESATSSLMWTSSHTSRNV